MNDLVSLLPPDGFPRFACDALLQSTAIGLLAWLLLLRVAGRAQVRAAVALAGLAACFAAPLLAVAVRAGGCGLLANRHDDGLEPGITQPIGDPTLLDAVSGQIIAHIEPDPTSNGQHDRSVAISASSGILPSPTARILGPRVSWWTLLCSVWLGASCVLFVRLLLSGVGLTRLFRQSHTCRDRGLQRLLDRAVAKLGLWTKPRLLISEHVDCPTVFPWGRPSVFLPLHHPDLSSSEWFAIFCHELAHVRRADGWSRLLAEIAVLMLPWQPLVWLLRRENFRASEEAADDWVVSAGADPVEFAATISIWIPTRVPALAIGGRGRDSDARLRIERLLKLVDTRVPIVGRFWSACTVVGVLSLAGVLAMLQPQAQSAPVQRLDPDRQAASDKPQQADQKAEGVDKELSESLERKIPGLLAVLGDGRMQHWHRPNVVGFSADGTRLVSEGTDGTIRFWDLATGKQLHRFETTFQSAAISADRRTLYVGKPDGSLDLIDVQTGKRRRSISSFRPANRFISLSADERLLASANRTSKGEAEIAIWDLNAGRRLRTIKTNGKGVTAIALSKDGSKLSAGSGGVLGIYDVATARELHRIRAHFDVAGSYHLYGLAFSPNGKLLASGSAEMIARVWDVESGKEIASLKKHMGTVSAVAFSPDGRTLASLSRESVKLWSSATWELLGEMKPGPAAAGFSSGNAVFSSDGALLACCSDTRIRVFNLKTKRELVAVGDPNNELTVVAASPTRPVLAVATRSGMLKLWDVASKEYRWIRPAHGTRIRRLEFSRDGKVLASAADDRSLALWNAETGQALHALEGSSLSFNSLAFHPDNLLAAALPGLRVGLWDVETGELQRVIEGDRTQRLIGQFAITNDGSMLLAARAPGGVGVFDLASGQFRAIPSRQIIFEQVPLAVSPNDRIIASGAGNAIQLSDLIAGQQVRMLAGHGDIVRSIAFNSKGAVLASAANDGTVRLWNPNTGRLMKTLEIGPGAGMIHKVVFTSDGKHLATANGNGTVYVLRLPQVGN